MWANFIWANELQCIQATSYSKNCRQITESLTTTDNYLTFQGSDDQTDSTTISWVPRLHCTVCVWLCPAASMEVLQVFEHSDVVWGGAYMYMYVVGVSALVVRVCASYMYAFVSPTHL